jgi:hypothetical protein
MAQDIEPIQMNLDADGNPTEVVALRWMDANPERVYRLQPFGSRMLETGRFGGFTIPTRVESATSTARPIMRRSSLPRSPRPISED